MGDVLGIYVHIPFCRSKCDYCDFYSLAGGEERMDDYQKALLVQIKERANLLRDYQVDTIYFGGGTPSYYGDARIREILGVIHRNFSLIRNPEITVECNPDSVDRKALSRLRRAGVNRISLGMQSADCAQLERLHRPHDFQQVRQAVEEIRGAKIKNLSLDVIYGLPGETVENWRETLEQAIALDPEHLSCYGLKVEEGTPLARRVEEGTELDIPDDDTQADRYLWTVDRLRSAGYRQYEISNFAKTGQESRHNLKYWMSRQYVGFGPGAHSDVEGCRYSYCKDLEGYIRGVLEGNPILDECQKISKWERSSEYLMLRMRTLRGIEEWEYRREFYLNFDPIQRKLEYYETRGWAEQSGHRWHFTPQGFLLSNQLIGGLLACQEEGPSPEALDSFLKRPQ